MYVLLSKTQGCAGLSERWLLQCFSTIFTKGEPIILRGISFPLHSSSLTLKERKWKWDACLTMCSEWKHSLAFSVLLPAKAQTKDIVWNNGLKWGTQPKQPRRNHAISHGLRIWSHYIVPWTYVEVENTSNLGFFCAGLSNEVNRYHDLYCHCTTWWVLVPSSVCDFVYDLSVAEPTRLLKRWDNAYTAEKTHAVICGERVCNTV